MKTLRKLPSYEELSKRFSYNPNTGKFTYLIDVGSIKQGHKTRGSKRKDGYCRISINGVSYLAHQLAWKLHHGEDAGTILDHINNDPSDNRIKNLRKSNGSLNNHNRRDVKGYSFDKSSQKWRANINVDGISKHLGLYETEAEASAAYRGVKKFCGLDK